MGLEIVQRWAGLEDGSKVGGAGGGQWWMGSR